LFENQSSKNSVAFIFIQNPTKCNSVPSLVATVCKLHALRHSLERSIRHFYSMLVHAMLCSNVYFKSPVRGGVVFP